MAPSSMATTAGKEKGTELGRPEFSRTATCMGYGAGMTADLLPRSAASGEGGDESKQGETRRPAVAMHGHTRRRRNCPRAQGED